MEPIKSDCHAGDLILFYGTDWKSRAIELATWGPSHVGIVTTHPTLGSLIVESTTLCELPCAIQGKTVSGVQAHPVDARRNTYPGRTRVMRLQPHWQLTQPETEFLRDDLLKWIGTPYDLPDALISGTKIFRFSHLAPYPDPASIFCSALCAVTLMRLNRFPLRDAWAINPAALVRRLRRIGMYYAVDEMPPAADPEPIILPFPGAHLPIGPALLRIFR